MPLCFVQVAVTVGLHALNVVRLYGLERFIGHQQRIHVIERPAIWQLRDNCARLFVAFGDWHVQLLECVQRFLIVGSDANDKTCLDRIERCVDSVHVADFFSVHRYRLFVFEDDDVERLVDFEHVGLLRVLLEARAVFELDGVDFHVLFFM